MKRHFLIFAVSAFMVMAAASGVLAGQPVSRLMFSSYSAVAGTTVYSQAVNVSHSESKSVVINGVYQSGAFGNFSGTVTLQCGPASTGPWTTCKDVVNTATSATSNTSFNLSGMIPYVRASWTKTKSRVSVWLYYFSE